MPNKADMPAALVHALYEMTMLIHSLPPILDPTQPPHIRSAWLEVFAVHARNLNEFFGKPRQGDDMKPEDFIDGWNHPYIFDTGLKTRADKQVSHLTYSRERSDQKTSWPVEEIFPSLRLPSMAFLNAVLQEKHLMDYEGNSEFTKLLLNRMPQFVFTSGVTNRANYVQQPPGISSSSPLPRYPAKP